MFLNILIAIAALMVLATLGLGIFSMVRGGEYARRNSNKFMRWRVTAQAVAVGLLLLAVFLKGQGG